MASHMERMRPPQGELIKTLSGLRDTPLIIFAFVQQLGCQNNGTLILTTHILLQMHALEPQRLVAIH